MSSIDYFKIDISTEEGQAEILAAWSRAVLPVQQAAWILKLTHAEFLALASQRGVTAPTPEAVAAHAAEIEAKFRPVARRSERDRVCLDLEETIERLGENAHRLNGVIGMSSETHLHGSRNLSLAALRELFEARDRLKMAVALLIDSATAEELLVNTPDQDASSQEKQK